MVISQTPRHDFPEQVLELSPKCCPVGTSLFACIEVGPIQPCFVVFRGSFILATCTLHFPRCLNWSTASADYGSTSLSPKVLLAMSMLLSHLVRWIPSLPSSPQPSVSHGPKSQIPVFDTICTNSCWPSGSVHSTMSPFPALARSSCPWSSPAEPCSHSQYVPALPLLYLWCPCGIVAGRNSPRTRQPTAASPQCSGSKTQQVAVSFLRWQVRTTDGGLCPWSQGVTHLLTLSSCCCND